MTASYSNNTQLPNLFVYKACKQINLEVVYCLHVSSKFAWSLEKITKTIYPQNHENFKNSKLRVQIY